MHSLQQLESWKQVQVQVQVYVSVCVYVLKSKYREILLKRIYRTFFAIDLDRIDWRYKSKHEFV